MIKGFYKYFVVLLFFIIFSVFSQENKEVSNKITSINFYQDGELSNLEIILDQQGVEAKKFHVIEDKQIIIEIKNAEATERVMRAFDTSEFSGSVVFVSAYKKPKSKDDIRIAVQLRDNVRSILRRQENKLVLIMENRFGVFSKAEVDEQRISDEKGAIEKVMDYNVPKSTSIQDILDNLTLSGKKKYVGSKISFNVRDIKIEDLLKMLSDSSGFNVITTPEIKAVPRMTLKLTNIPWDQALDLILDLNKLVARKKGAILLVTTAEKAAQEEAEKLKAKDLAIKQEPLVTKIFPISYAELGDMQKVVTEYLTKKRGKISQDVRTNSLIIKDTAEVMERMIKIIDALDTQTPQILIESKIVEVAEAYAQEIGLTDGVSWGYDPIADPTTLEDAGPGFTFSTSANSQVFGVNIANFGRVNKLLFQLQLMESESKAKVITSPKIITENNKEAVISSTEDTSFRTQTIVDGVTQSNYESISATLSLTVKPKVTNEGSIVMSISVKKDSFANRPEAGAPPDKTARSITTNVLVDNGSTIVIGGIYTFSEDESHSGIPFLKDLPLVGWLFRSLYNPSKSKKEMVVFLTPRIINQEEAGLAGSEEKVL